MRPADRDRTHCKVNDSGGPGTQSRVLAPMTPEWIRYHQELQADEERLGKWELANQRNAWLAGAFMTEADAVAGRIPAMRRDFLKRSEKASSFASLSA